MKGRISLPAVLAAVLAFVLLAIAAGGDVAYAKSGNTRSSVKAGSIVKKSSHSAASADKRKVKRHKAKIRKDKPAKPLVAAGKRPTSVASGKKHASVSSKQSRGASKPSKASKAAMSSSRGRHGKEKSAVLASPSKPREVASASISRTITKADKTKAGRVVTSSKTGRTDAAALKAKKPAKLDQKGKKDGPAKVVAAKKSKRKKVRVAKASKRRPGPLVVIDPGHGGHDPGAMAGGLVEKDVTLSVARMLGKRLAKAGFRVKYTRTSDKTISPYARLRMASRLKPALFISLHCNSAPSTKERGLETFAYLPKRRHDGRGSVVPIEEVSVTSDSSVQARSIHERLTRSVGSRGVADNGTRLGRFAVLSPRPWPSVLIEMGYLTNKYDAKRLASGKFRAWFAAQLATVLGDHLKPSPQILASAKEGPSRKSGGRSSRKAAPAS